MIVTPSQARRLACPFMRGADMKVLACKGNDCMAFRWADTHSAWGYCGAAGIPEIHRLQAGDRPLRDGPVQGGRTVLSRTPKTLDAGEVPTAPKTRGEFNREITDALAKKAASDEEAGRF